MGECVTYLLQVKLPHLKVIPISTILGFNKIKKHFISKNGNPKMLKVNRTPFVKIITAQKMKLSIEDFFINVTKSAVAYGFGHIY